MPAQSMQNDALALPMPDVFDPKATTWSYRAEAADVLRATKLPNPANRYSINRASAACVPHTAAYWAAAMKGQDFTTEDHLDTTAYNIALWNGLGSGPRPSVRSGTDLRSNRRVDLSTSSGEGQCHGS